MVATSARKNLEKPVGPTVWIAALAGCSLWLGLATAASATSPKDEASNRNLLLQPDISEPYTDLSRIENGLTLINHDTSNQVSTSGASQRGSTNRMTITLSGTGNGGLGESWPAAFLVPDFQPNAGGFAPASLTPGSFAQIGSNNVMDVKISGASNRSAAYQSGIGNALTASVSGNDNMSAVYQAGTANFSAYTQTGSNNNLGISQTSW